jgi:hypothetical protein
MILVRAGQMAHANIDLEPVEQRNLVEPQSEPVHPGVDHHVARAIFGDLSPARDLLGGV